jgi:hypothetical protein
VWVDGQDGYLGFEQSVVAQREQGLFLWLAGWPLVILAAGDAKLVNGVIMLLVARCIDHLVSTGWFCTSWRWGGPAALV